MTRPIVFLGVLLVVFAVSTRPVDGYEERQCHERIINVDIYAKMTPEQKKAHYHERPIHVSISNQDSVVFEWENPFTVVKFVQTYKEPKGLADPFVRHTPIKALKGTDENRKTVYRASTGPASEDQPAAVLKLLAEGKGITYKALLKDKDGKPIDPHIEITQ